MIAMGQGEPDPRSAKPLPTQRDLGQGPEFSLALLPRVHPEPAAVPAPATPDPVAVCVEVGASGMQTALLDRFGRLTFRPGLAVPPKVPLLVAAPGLLRGTRVIAASNLGWFDLPVAEALGIDATVHLLRNDAEAAALGEHVLRGSTADLIYVGLGTGVGGAVVSGGDVTGNLFGHGGEFSDRPGPCGQVGCLETVAAGWALGDPATPEELAAAAAAVAAAVTAAPAPAARLVVVAGGLARRHRVLVELVRAALPGYIVEPTAAPPEAKSAAAWGLLHLRTT